MNLKLSLLLLINVAIMNVFISHGIKRVYKECRNWILFKH